MRPWVGRSAPDASPSPAGRHVRWHVSVCAQAPFKVPTGFEASSFPSISFPERVMTNESTTRLPSSGGVTTNAAVHTYVPIHAVPGSPELLPLPPPEPLPALPASVDEAASTVRPPQAVRTKSTTRKGNATSGERDMPRRYAKCPPIGARAGDVRRRS